MLQSRVISLEALKDRTGVTDNQLDKEVDDTEDLATLGHHIVDYRRYGAQLGLGEDDFKEIEQNPVLYFSIRLKAKAVFQEWHRMKGKLATYRGLVDVALKLEDGKAAERICNVCKESKFADSLKIILTIAANVYVT